LVDKQAIALPDDLTLLTGEQLAGLLLRDGMRVEIA